MKKLLTITAILISVVSFSQNLKLYKSTDDIKVSDLLYRKYLDKPIDFVYTDSSIVVDNFTWLVIQPEFISKKTYQIDIKGVLTVSANRDTLEIQSKDIKYIKVDGKIYEIKRTTELKQIEPKIEIKNWYAVPNGWTSYPLNLPTVDTSFFLKRIKNNDSISSFRLSDWYKISDSSLNYSYKDSISKVSYRIYYDSSVKNYIRAKALQNNKNKKVKKQDLSTVFYIGVSDTSAMAVGVFSPKKLRKLEEDRLKLLQHDNKEFRKYLIEKFNVSAEEAAKEADRRYVISIK